MDSICLVQAAEHRSSKILLACISAVNYLIFPLEIFFKMFSATTDSCFWSTVKSTEKK